MKPEKIHVEIGFVPLNDCAPLVAAHEKGFFEAEGVTVTLHRERSWASIRDKIAVGMFDAAHMLYPLPLAMTLGVGGPVTPTVTALCLNLNGNAITLSSRLCAEMIEADPALDLSAPLDAGELRAVIKRRQDAGREPLTFGVVFPTSTHHYELRYWLAAAGVDADIDVRIIVLPPPDMPEALNRGVIDGCCVGEPWNSFAVQRGWGRIVITKQQLWNNFPEKVFGVTQRWADANPGTHLALLRAIISAAAWCDDADNRAELTELISLPHYIDAPADVVGMSMLGTLQFAQTDAPTPQPNFHVFHRFAANFPWRSHAVWYLAQMVKVGQIDAPKDFGAIADCVMLPDLYRTAAAKLSVAAPSIDAKTEGTHVTHWMLEQATQQIPMPPDLLFDGQTFDPANPLSLLDPHDSSSVSL